jgi:tetratricopeptide (TPR) repeat protein
MFYIGAAMAETPKVLTGEQALAVASALYAQGRLVEAEKLYSAVLSRNPDHPGSLHALGVIALQRNAPAEALAPLEKAVALAPDWAEAHNDLGMALAGLSRRTEAAAHFERAIALKPDFATAHNNYGNALLALDRHRDAIRQFESALAHRPGYATAEFNLAHALTERERHEKAAEHYRKALEARPDWIVALCGLAHALHMSNHADDALAYYRRALALDGKSAEAWHGIGTVTQTLGRLDESRAALEKALALKPDFPAYFRSISEIHRFTANDPLLARMEALAANMTALPEVQQAELHFALGKAYGDIGERERSFAHFIDGNAAKRHIEDYDEDANLEMMRHIESVFTADLLARNANAGDPSKVPVFILGMPRSGSTLTEQILASHPSVFGAGEMRYLGEAARSFRGQDASDYFPDVMRELTPGQLRDFGARYVEQLRGWAPEAARITDKMPANFRFVGLIRMVLPNAKIIHTRRDPLDTCMSCFTRLFGKKSFTSDLVTLGRYYRQYETLMAHWRTVLPDGAMLEVQYEELVGDFENQARRIVAYCGLEWDDKCREFHQNPRPVRTASVTQVRQPIYRSAIGRWKPYEMMLQPLLNELGTTKM